MTTSQSDRDRQHFDSIAEAYFAKDLAPAHRAARALRLKQTVGLVTPSTDGRLLEVGCGGGFAASYLKGHYREYLGVDHSERLVEFATDNVREDNVSFQCVDINNLKTPELFDLTFMIGLLHHLEDPVTSLRTMATLVKPGGWIVANEPQNGNPLISVARSWRKRVDTSYSDDQVDFSKLELVNMFQDAGLVDIRVQAQGLFSTPFAEVVMPLQGVVTPLSRASCALDKWLERRQGNWLQYLSWNLVVAGRRA